MQNFFETWCADGKSTARYCEKLFPQDKDDTLRRAEQICRKSFLFDKRWEMERTWDEVVFEGEIDWEYRPLDDPEWTFAFNRHSFLIDLAKAYAYTDEERYAQKAADFMSDFIDRVLPNEDTRKTTWRPIEVGIRCENWLKTLGILGGTEAFAKVKDKINAALRVHADELVNSHGEFQRLSNWGVLQDHGLFLLGAYFDEQKYIDLAVERLSENLSLQVLPDGVHWEQSPMYHGEVLHCFLEVVQCAKRMDIALPKQFLETVERMSLALAGWNKSNGHLVCQSDTDDIDARDLLGQAAVLFCNGELKFHAGQEICAELVWEMGEGVEQEYERLPRTQPQTVSTALSQSGNYQLRDSWAEQGNYLHFHCGALGSGHGHANLLHFDIFAQGEDILVDSGRYTYVDNADRAYLKSAAAHNTVLVDGKEFTPYRSSWSYHKIAQPIAGTHYFGQYADYVSGGHLGYINEGVFHYRKIVYLKPNVYFIFDEMHTGGKHSCERNFHFNPQGEVAFAENENAVLYQGQSAKAKMLLLDEGCQLSLGRSGCSQWYNKLEQGAHLRVKNEHAGFACMVTAVATEAVDKPLEFFAERVPVTLVKSGREIPPSLATGIRAVVKGEEYYVIVCHEEIIDEVDLLCAGGYSGYGKAMVFGKGLAETLNW